MTKTLTVRVGSRASKLAQTQAREVIAALKAAHPWVRFIHRTFLEVGDRDRTSPLADVSAQAGGAAFANDQERRLVEGAVDLIVHSLKDLPTDTHPATVLLGTPQRAESRDVLFGTTLARLSDRARIGTSSVRRRAQLLHRAPRAEVVPIRGNVPPRLNKMAPMRLDGIVLAAAGLDRLALSTKAMELLPADDFCPAPGQGALGLQAMAADSWLAELVASIRDPVSDARVRAERALMATVGGGCAIPLGAHAVALPDGRLSLHGQVVAADGSDRIDATATGTLGYPERLGELVGRLLLEEGAQRLLGLANPLPEGIA